MVGRKKKGARCSGPFIRILSREPPDPSRVAFVLLAEDNVFSPTFSPQRCLCSG
jgi:hypothetical protein